VIDGLGAVQNVLLVGGTSEIGLAIADFVFSKNRGNRLIVSVKAESDVDRVRSELSHRYNGISIDVEVMNMLSSGSLEEKTRSIFAISQIDVAILAAGLLPDAVESFKDAQVAVNSTKVNFLGPMEVGTEVIEQFRKQGHGRLVVLSSVAGERPRKDNYVYGAAKAGLDAWANGLADSVHGSPIRVLIVRPGMVRTKMSAGLPEAPFTCDPDAVGRAVLRRLNEGPALIWVPGKLRIVMSVLRHLPRFLFRRLSRGVNTQNTPLA
jgi:decaprenylphospho-beta-D-erythro-pentofuranosid-2-ulose 2-reductase